jgi:hypothetical protein
MKAYPIAHAALLAATTLAIPALSQARTVTISTTLKHYGGGGAYVAVYLTGPHGAYDRTLWIAGRRSRYYRHLTEWRRLSERSTASLDGVTGASDGEGRTLKVTADLADALFDAGYEIHVDAAVEDMHSSPFEIQVPLTRAGSGRPHAGRQFVQTFTYQVR